jgi:thioester reductase-like protein
MKNILVTGATGFVGKYLVSKLLENPNNRIFLLIRSQRHLSAIDRCKNIFHKNADLISERIIPIEGELTQPMFNLDEHKFEELARKISTIYHTAATIKFNLPYKTAHTINVEGTKTCLLLAEKAGVNFERFHHVSTAYVNRIIAGKEREFNNTYEQTKFEAELLFKNVNYTIYRPSIISGSSETGEISSSSVIYKFIILLSRRILSVLPVDNSFSINIIPVNNFVDKMLSIGESSDSIGKIYQLTHQENTNFKDLLIHASNLLKVPPPKFIPESQTSLIPHKVMKQIDVFMPYIIQSQKFKLNQHELNSAAKTPSDNVITTFNHIIENYLSYQGN